MSPHLWKAYSPYRDEPLNVTSLGFFSQSNTVVRTAAPVKIAMIRVCLLYSSANVIRTASYCSEGSLSIVVKEFEISCSCDGAITFWSLDRKWLFRMVELNRRNVRGYVAMFAMDQSGEIY